MKNDEFCIKGLKNIFDKLVCAKFMLFVIGRHI